MELIPAKSILNRVGFGEQWFGVDYNFNLYRGCPHGCIYCDSRWDVYGIQDFDRVRAKAGGLEILERELAHKRNRGVVGIGAMSDAYNPAEMKACLTREALRLLSQYCFGLSIETKSSLILRDLDLLTEINEKNNVILKLSIATPRDGIARQTEPRACPPSERLRAVRELARHGLFAGILMDPILPFVTDREEDIRGLVRLGAENGAKFIYAHFMGVTLRGNQRLYFLEQLERLFPGLSREYDALDGPTYRPPHHRQLRAAFEEECRRCGVLYRMEDIIRGYRRF